MKTPFNKPYLTGKETVYINEAVNIHGHLAGNGVFTKKCQSFFESRYGFKKTLLTTSCTDALEMASMLINIEPGDEVIVPSYTFVSTALAFVRQGAKIIFADSLNSHPNIDHLKLPDLITNRTKAIVVVHYAGVAVDMDPIMALAKENNIFVIEDAAQAIDSYYKDRPLGGIGHLGTFSFHETKNIISGEGGMLVINDENLLDRAEIIWEKGTNRASFFRGEINKYSWVDIGSSFLPSEATAAFLYAQLEKLDVIQERRLEKWQLYYTALEILQLEGTIQLSVIPEFATNNAHIFYVVCRSMDERDALINALKTVGVLCVFHYLSLHRSEYYLKSNELVDLPNADIYADRLLRLPMFFELSSKEIRIITNTILDFYNES